ncbi:hypothetical protein HC928_01635 [bacterium]|nr:hypothetical protein [bacterium]
MALLIMLERRTPTERADYLLREVFDYDYKEIATIVDKSEPAGHQIVSRVKARIVEERPRLPVTEATPIVQQMVAAVKGGDVTTMEPAPGTIELQLSENAWLQLDDSGDLKVGGSIIRLETDDIEAIHTKVKALKPDAIKRAASVALFCRFWPACSTPIPC